MSTMGGVPFSMASFAIMLVVFVLIGWGIERLYRRRVAAKTATTGGAADRAESAVGDMPDIEGLIPGAYLRGCGRAAI